MRFRFIILLSFFTFFFAVANAQSKKERKKSKEEQVDINKLKNTSRFPAAESNIQKAAKSKKFKKERKGFAAWFKKSLDNKVDEFHERMEQNAKRDKKMRRKMDHPQYSDFSYFGHKKKPKIRPVGKKKFCKECGIKH